MAFAASMTLAQLNSVTECWSNVNDKKALERVFVLIIAEFAKIVSDGGKAAYTVTAGLQGLLTGAIDNVSNTLRVEFLTRWFTVLVSEFTDVQTEGAAYAVTTSSTGAFQELNDLLDQAIDYMTDSQKRIGMHSIDALISAEFAAVAAA